MCYWRSTASLELKSKNGISFIEELCRHAHAPTTDVIQNLAMHTASFGYGSKFQQTVVLQSVVTNHDTSHFTIPTETGMQTQEITKIVTTVKYPSLEANMKVLGSLQVWL